MTNSKIININEIYSIFQENHGKEIKKSDGVEFQKFLNFLEIDFYDWINENLNQFYKQH